MWRGYAERVIFGIITAKMSSQGWNRPHVDQSAGNGKRQDRRSCPTVVRGVFAGILVVALGGLAAWWFFAGGSTPVRKIPDDAANRRIKEVKPAKGKVRIEKKRREVVKTGDRMKDALAEVEASSELVTISAPPKREAKITNSRANRFYKNGVEQLLNWVAMTEPGDMPMPMPFLSEEEKADLVNILSIPCSIKDDDDDYLKALKESVNYGKKEMANFVADGGEPDEFFSHYFEQLKQTYETHSEAQAAYGKMVEEDSELAPQFREKVNELLAQKGIKPIEPDSTVEPEEYAKLHPEEIEKQEENNQ